MFLFANAVQTQKATKQVKPTTPLLQRTIVYTTIMALKMLTMSFAKLFHFNRKKKDRSLSRLSNAIETSNFTQAVSGPFNKGKGPTSSEHLNPRQTRGFLRLPVEI
jgi:ABC-type Na+ transport system ATPase subunit NatA